MVDSKVRVLGGRWVHAACTCHSSLKDGTGRVVSAHARTKCRSSSPTFQAYLHFVSAFQVYPWPTHAMTMSTALSHVDSPESCSASSSRRGNDIFKSSALSCEIPAVHDNINRKEGGGTIASQKRGPMAAYLSLLVPKVRRQEENGTNRSTVSHRVSF